MRKKKIVLILLPMLLLIISVSANAAFLLTRAHTESLRATDQSIANVSDLLTQSTVKIKTLKQQLSDTKDQNTNLLNNQNTLFAALNVTGLDAAEAKINDMSKQIAALKDMGITNVDQITGLKEQLAELKTSLSLGDDFDPTTNLVDSVNNTIDEQVAAKIAEQTQALETKVETLQTLVDRYADIFADAGTTADWIANGPVLNKVTDPMYIATAQVNTWSNPAGGYTLGLKKIGAYYVFSIFNGNSQWIWSGASWVQGQTIQNAAGDVFLNAYRDGYWQPFQNSLATKTLNNVSTKDYIMVYASSSKKTEKAFLPGLPATVNRSQLASQTSTSVGNYYGWVSGGVSVTWVPDATNSVTGTFQITVAGYVSTDGQQHVYQYVPHPNTTDSIYSGGATNRTINDVSNVWKEIK